MREENHYRQLMADGVVCLRKLRNEYTKGGKNSNTAYTSLAGLRCKPP